MNEMIQLFRGALVLDTKTFADLKASPDVFRKGFMFVLIVGLIVGLVTGLVGLVQGLTTSPAQQKAQALEGMKQFTAFMPPEAVQQMLDSMEMGFRIGERISKEAKAPLPGQVETLFKQIGVVVSQPFGWLASLILYGALVHIFAKLLGGRATIAQMFGVSSLTVAPHLLDALGWVPCLGGLFGLVAFVWCVVVYVKGTAVAHEMSNGKALLAVLLPIIVGVLLVVLLFVVLFILIAASGGR